MLHNTRHMTCACPHRSQHTGSAAANTQNVHGPAFAFLLLHRNTVQNNWSHSVRAHTGHSALAVLLHTPNVHGPAFAFLLLHRNTVQNNWSHSVHAHTGHSALALLLHTQHIRGQAQHVRGLAGKAASKDQGCHRRMLH